MKKSPAKLEFIQLVLLAAMRKAKLYCFILSFTVFLSCILGNARQTRFLYLSLLLPLFPEILAALITTLQSHREKSKKTEAQVAFPMLRKKTNFSVTAFYAHLLTFVLYYVSLAVLCAKYSSAEVPLLRYISFVLTATSVLASVLALITSHRNLKKHLLPPV